MGPAAAGISSFKVFFRKQVAAVLDAATTADTDISAPAGPCQSHGTPVRCNPIHF